MKTKFLENKTSDFNITVNVATKYTNLKNKILKININNRSIENLKINRNLYLVLSKTLEEQIVKFGYKLVDSDSDITILIKVNCISVNIKKNIMLYNVTSCIEASIIAIGFNNWKITKYYRSIVNARKYFHITNNEINNIIYSTLLEIVNNIKHDCDIYHFIKLQIYQYIIR